MGFSLGSYVFEVAALGVVCAFVLGSPAGAATVTRSNSRPSVTVVGVTRVAPGARITARLEGFPAGTTTVGVCGNAARRGSEDCSLVGDVAVAVRGSSATLVDLTVVAPPVPCPCVVRAGDAGSDLARTTPIALVGVANGPALAASHPEAESALDVRSSIESRGSWTQSLSRSFAGPASKTLVITLHNRGSAPMRNLRVVADVGRNATSGSPVIARTVTTIAPGSEVTLRATLPLSAPSFGNYEVSGTVYGLAAPASFAVGTSNDPWALELAVPIALLALAQYLRRRERAAETEPAAA